MQEFTCFFFLWHCSPTRAMASSFLRFLDHTQRRITVGRTPLDEWSARRRDLYLTTHNTHNRQTSMAPVGLEPTISAGERPQTYALDRVATGTGSCYVRNINSSTIYEYQCILSTESWEDIFEGFDTNVIFNNFSNIYLKIFNACFTKSKQNSARRYNPWITGGIKIQCQNKRILDIRCRGSNDTNLKLRYKRYCKILTDFIKTAKKKKVLWRINI